MSEMNENISYVVTRYMLKNINTKTKSKYTRVSRPVSGRDRPHGQVSSLESWHFQIINNRSSSQVKQRELLSSRKLSTHRFVVNDEQNSRNYNS